MNRLIVFVVTIALALNALSSCENKRLRLGKTETREDSGVRVVDAYACGSQLVAKELHAELARTLRDRTKEKAAGNFPNLVDPDRIARGFDRSRFVVNSPRLDPGVRSTATRTECLAGLNLMIDQTVYDMAQSNAPLVYKGGRYGEEIDKASSENRVSRVVNNLVMDIHYGLDMDDQGQITRVDLRASEIDRLERVLGVMLLPYGVRDRVVVDGRPMSREEGLAKLNFRQDDFRFEERPGEPLDPDMRRRRGDSGEGDSEFGSPYRTEYDPARLRRLEDERNRLRNRIEGVWASLDGSIRQTLGGEQAEWSRRTRSECSTSPSKSSEGVMDERASLECEIDRLRQRVSYLQGFGI